MTMRMDELVSLGIPAEIVDIWKQEESEQLLPVQELAIKEGGALAGKNLLVVAPTSSGKTFIGEISAVQKSLQRAGSIFLVPYKAMAEEKYLDFRDKYDAYGIRVVISSGDRSVGAHLNLDKSEPPAEYRVVNRSGFE
jgi:helicase